VATLTKEQKKQRRERLSKFRTEVPHHDRTGEVIGGGFIVIERTDIKQRLRPAAWPYECATMEQAIESRDRLLERHPDRAFFIFADAERGLGK
jgi:hypothetical protein